MTIRNRLMLIASITFGVVFALAALAVYYTFHVSSERIIFSELQKTGLLSAMFYLEEDELPAREHNRIRTEFEVEMQQTDVKVYDGGDHLRYGNGQRDGQLTKAMLQRIRSEGRLRFKEDGYYFYGMHYPDNQGDFVVVVAASNSFFTSQSNQLLLMIIVALAIGFFIIFLLSYWLSGVAYRPVAAVIRQMGRLQADNLEQQLVLPKATDELRELVATFNGLLMRLSDTFIIQKNFVNYVSHEFKTPLAAITGTMEVFAQKQRSPQEYQEVVHTVLGHVGDLEQLLNNLLVLAGLRNTPQVGIAYRVDEVLWDVLDMLSGHWPQVKSLVSMAVEVANPEKLSILGNREQMRMVFYNIIENAIKYGGGGAISIVLKEVDEQLTVTVEDCGHGITAEELTLVQEPFYRGSNVGDTKGSGIGLSLAVLICKQNNVEFRLTSQVGAGTKAVFRFGQL